MANTSYKSSVRETERRSKEMAKHYRQKLKQQIATQQDDAVHTYNAYLDLLLYAHEGVSEPLNWNSFTSDQEPMEPVFWRIWENEAEFELKNYEPSFFDILIGRDRRKIRKLRKKLEEARSMDMEVHLFNQQNYRKNKQDWKHLQEMKAGIEKGDPSAYQDAIDYFDPYASITQLGSVMDYKIYSEYLRINVYIDAAEIIPDFIFAKTATDELVMNKLSTERFNKIYHDYICSSAVLIARETFALLPVKYIHLNMMSGGVASVGQGSESKAILAVKFSTEMLKQSNEQLFGCLKALVNLPERIQFSVVSGFSSTSQKENQGDMASSI